MIGSLAASSVMAKLETWHEVCELYSEYAELLDSLRLAEWLDLFCDDCLYQVVSAENERLGLPLALMRCEGKAGLSDRVRAIQKTLVYAPRIMRHLVSGIRVTVAGDQCLASASFAVLASPADGPAGLFCAGRFDDVIERVGTDLRFVRKRAIYDNPLVPGAMVYPI